MNKDNPYDKDLGEVIAKLVNVVVLFFLIIIGLLAILWIVIPKDNSPVFSDTKIANSERFSELNNSNSSEKNISDSYWKSPTIDTISNKEKKELITYGKELITNTSLYFGREGKVFKSGTNGMNCQNCHLDAGTKIYGNNYSAVASTYPKYRARSGTNENIYKRINDCFERSLNGKSIDTNSTEMKAMATYITWLGSTVNKGKKPEGSGLKEIELLSRAASPAKGNKIYIQKCQSCHQKNGEGLLNPENTGYTYPPLWGMNSYNDGAGLFRISNFAKFVKYNMPQGVNHESPQLNDEEAWDVAAFVNSQKRPHKNISKDWPKIKEKPFDHPFGPFSDGKSETEHKYGPFDKPKNKGKNS